MKYLAAGVICVLIFIAGFLFGRFTATSGGVIPFSSSSDSENVSTEEEADGGTAVDSSQMTEGQRQMLQAMGIDPNSVTITAEMVACAEAKIGAARVEEIKNGATPSFSEGAMLLGCYQQ